MAAALPIGCQQDQTTNLVPQAWAYHRRPAETGSRSAWLQLVPNCSGKTCSQVPTSQPEKRTNNYGKKVIILYCPSDMQSFVKHAYISSHSSILCWVLKTSDSETNGQNPFYLPILLRARALTLSLPRVTNVKFLLQPHLKYYITQYEEHGFS